MLFDLFEFRRESANLRGVVVTAVGAMLHRIGVTLFQLGDALFYGGFVVADRLVPDRRMAAAACTARAPIDRNGIRAVYRLPDKDCIEYIQLDTLHDREHPAYPSVLVELLGRIAEKQSAFVCPHVKDNLVDAVSETLEIGDPFGVVPTTAKR